MRVPPRTYDEQIPIDPLFVRLEMNNYCRNPDKDKPWCFTSETESGYCDVTQCKLVLEMLREIGSREFAILAKMVVGSTINCTVPWHTSLGKNLVTS